MQQAALLCENQKTVSFCADPASFTTGGCLAWHAANNALICKSNYAFLCKSKLYFLCALGT
jgi:hypothetical protein